LPQRASFLFILSLLLEAVEVTLSQRTSFFSLFMIHTSKFGAVYFFLPFPANSRFGFEELRQIARIFKNVQCVRGIMETTLFVPTVCL
jgi:hypothetical protein